MIRKLVLDPDERLKKISKSIEIIDDNIKQLVNDMFETMYHNNGIGLAAVQVGELIRLLVMDVEQYEDGSSQMCFINPKITYKSKELFNFSEGCLSFPKSYQEISRPAIIDVEYQDINGKKKKLNKIDGLLAVCIQHEMDHLDGITILDHNSDKIENELFCNNYNNMK